MKTDSGINTTNLVTEDSDSPELKVIVNELVPEYLELFAAKNADYGSFEESAGVLGVRGQFADIWRKIPKLKRALWDGDDLEFEGVDEVVLDLIGHLFLTLYMLRTKERVEREHAYSVMSTDEFLDKLIEEYGGPAQASMRANILGTDLANRLIARCGQALTYDRQDAQVEAGVWFPEADPTPMTFMDKVEAVAKPMVIHSVSGPGSDNFQVGGEVHITFAPARDDSLPKWLHSEFGTGPAIAWDDLEPGEHDYWRAKADAYEAANYKNQKDNL